MVGSSSRLVTAQKKQAVVFESCPALSFSPPPPQKYGVVLTQLRSILGSPDAQSPELYC
ncbi:unnamed protein product [Dibothriocephalus latus]|uniref:Uncharacterized protein n=1 Tax=Dibothriocephalus latus TaxID=60516 RepID=A0A3P7N684_DIBLA|nr:unnamed protein product [Dibothriocephalus latus]